MAFSIIAEIGAVDVVVVDVGVVVVVVASKLQQSVANGVGELRDAEKRRHHHHQLLEVVRGSTRAADSRFYSTVVALK